MSKSTDPDHFFQTDHSIAETRRRAVKSTNKHGNPIRLESRILAVIADFTHPNAIFIAESSATARRISLNDNKISAPYRGPTAPATSLALSPPNTGPPILFAGSWDKNIYSWQTPSRTAHCTYRNGHTDFVKAVVTDLIRSPGSPSPTSVLISGGADARIIIWAITAGEKLYVLRPSENLGGAVLGLAITPTAHENNNEPLTIFTANTLPPIRRFSLSQYPPTLTEISPQNPITVHQTSVYGLCFDSDGKLWTASADGDITCLAPEKNWAEEMRIKTTGCVRGVAVDEEGVWVVSVGRDEEVRVWNKETGELHHTYSGHYDEILGVVVLDQMAVTVGLDGTVRRWSLKGHDMEDARKRKNGEEGGEAQGEESGTELEGQLGSLITEEEEMELMELMGDG